MTTEPFGELLFELDVNFLPQQRPVSEYGIFGDSWYSCFLTEEWVVVRLASTISNQIWKLRYCQTDNNKKLAAFLLFFHWYDNLEKTMRETPYFAGLHSILTLDSIIEYHFTYFVSWDLFCSISNFMQKWHFVPVSLVVCCSISQQRLYCVCGSLSV